MFYRAAEINHKGSYVEYIESLIKQCRSIYSVYGENFKKLTKGKQ